jgi:mono/diheme cytochrome c family protein
MKSNLLIIGIGLTLLSCQSKEEVLHEQYRVEGLALYQKHCENCHQADGKGFKKLYPALVGTDLLKRVSERQMAVMIKKGIAADANHEFMPGNAELQAIEIAEIITYLKDLNGVKEGIVDQKRIMNYEW